MNKKILALILSGAFLMSGCSLINRAPAPDLPAGAPCSAAGVSLSVFMRYYSSLILSTMDCRVTPARRLRIPAVQISATQAASAASAGITTCG